MPLINVIQGTPEWHAARRGRIGASIAAACLGLDPYVSRQKAWRIILGKETIETTWQMQRGLDDEPAARLAYECETGNLVHQTGVWVHPFLPWLAASPDGLIGDDLGLEIKRPEVLPTRIPDPHIVQMTVGMLCTDREAWDYFAWTPQGHYLERLVLCGPFAATVLMRLEEFWKEYIVGHLEPPRMKPRKPVAVENPMAGILADIGCAANVEDAIEGLENEIAGVLQ